MTKRFFDEWGKADEHEIEYIKKAVLRKSIKLHTECKNHYEQFCKKERNGTSENNNNLVEKLVEEIFVKKISYHYEDYAVENGECTYSEFIEKLKFEFANKEKTELLEKLQKETEEKIIQDYFGISENVRHG